MPPNAQVYCFLTSSSGTHNRGKLLCYSLLMLDKALAKRPMLVVFLAALIWSALVLDMPMHSFFMPNKLCPLLQWCCCGCINPSTNTISLMPTQLSEIDTDVVLAGCARAPNGRASATSSHNSRHPGHPAQPAGGCWNQPGCPCAAESSSGRRQVTSSLPSLCGCPQQATRVPLRSSCACHK